jgi:ABC-2 type transport system ATP-binding protein
MNEMMISVEGFRKTYDKLVAVDGISFEVKRGEIFGLLGPNGAGKTSTLECLEGLRSPDGGELRVAGIDPTRQFRQLRDVMGVQLQSSALPENIHVDEVMNLFCAYHHTPPRQDLLERLDLADKRSAQYHQLSGGQQRRLSLALAVAHQPQVLFLDEPTSGMRQLQADGTTIILATHDMAEAEAMADHIAILLRGRIAALGTPLEITASGAGLSKISVRTEGDCLVKDETNFPGVEQRQVKEEYVVYFSSKVGASVSAIIAYLEGHGDPLIDLRIERPSLEDRFLEITEDKKAGGGA